MPVSATFDIGLRASQSGANGFGGPFWSGEMLLSQAFADGVNANEVNRLYVAERTVASGANDDIDLNGTMQDALGGAIAAAELVAFFIMNRRRDPSGAANTTNLTIGGSTSGVPGYTAASDVVRPGGWVSKGNPDANGLAAITAGTGDILRVTNAAGASNTYTVGILLRTS